MLRELWDAIMRVTFGHNAVDNTKDWYKSYEKAKSSRAEVNEIIKQSEEQNKKGKI